MHKQTGQSCVIPLVKPKERSSWEINNIVPLREEEQLNDNKHWFKTYSRIFIGNFVQSNIHIQIATIPVLSFLSC